MLTLLLSTYSLVADSLAPAQVSTAGVMSGSAPGLVDLQCEQTHAHGRRGDRH